jgi:polysaccharide export outer membrane protein
MPPVRRLFLCAAFALTGCSTPKLINTGAVAIVPSDGLPAPTPADLTVGTRTHFVGPGDLVAVDVFGLPELSREARVDANGDISLPVAGRISTVGATPEQLAGEIESRLKAGYVRDPQVSVGVVETVSQVVTLEGEVQRPGVYPVVGEMTLMRAIARAEGTSDTAAANHVVIFRTVSGQSMAALYDLRAIRQAAYRDPRVYTNDVIVVGESTARRLFPQILQAAGLLVSPLVAVLNNNNN